MNILTITFIAFMVIVMPACHSLSNNKPNHDIEVAIGQTLSDTIKSTEPGVQYIVVNNKSILYKTAIGMADIKNNIRLTSRHKMSAFSMTKTLTAIAILQLAENKQLSLDHLVSDYYEHPYHSNTTIRYLITHSAGIPNPIPLKWVHLSSHHALFNEDDALKRVLNQHPDTTAKLGEKYQYSNIAYWLLGKIIESASQQPYTEYVTEHIFNRVNLTSNEIAFEIDKNETYVKGYLKRWSMMSILAFFLVDDETLGENESGWRHINDVYLNGPSFGGAIGSATAFSRILQDLLLDKSKLLNTSSKSLLFTPNSTSSDSEPLMTLGWHIGKLKGDHYFYKEGGGAGFHSEMRIYPKQNIASVIMTNRTSFDSRRLLSELDLNILNL